ncbi:MAG: alpha/beta fold hydrolase [Thermoanaerobaculia bacterium]
MDSRPLRHVDLHTSTGRLEALYREIERPVGVAVVAHPHPLGGGTLHNKVVFRAARGLEAAGIATIRFNFRGVGASQGKHEQGDGEQADFEAALNWIIGRHPGAKVIAGGFSFGAWVGSRVACTRADVDAVFLIGAPINKYNLVYLKRCDKPLLFIHGSRDEFGDAERLGELAEHCMDAEMVLVSGADHFFKDQLDIVEATLTEWATRIAEGG